MRQLVADVEFYKVVCTAMMQPIAKSFMACKKSEWNRSGNLKAEWVND